MSVALNINGVSYTYPESGDTGWGNQASSWAQAVTSGMLQKAGGTFVLTSNVDFGASFGLVSTHFSARTSNVASTGTLRLAASNFIAFRNQANSADLPLSINLSNQLTFDGQVLINAAYAGIVNANISASAAIAFSKMAVMSASRAAVSDGSGFLVPATTTATEIGYVNGVTSAIQTQLNAKLNLAGGTLTGALLLDGDPSLSNQAATKQYVDNAMLGLSPKAAVVAGTTSPGTLATDFENGDTLDGVTLSTGDRILIKDQTVPTENGIYIVAASGAPARATDANVWSEFVQAYVLVTEGTFLAGSGWLCTASPGGTIGVDPVVFVQFSSSTTYSTDGQGIELTGSQFSLELDGVTLSKSGSGLRLNASVVSDIASKLTNPLTTTGDLIYSSSGTTGSRLGIGSTGQMLTVVAGVPAWQSYSLNPTVVSVSGNVVLTSADANKVYLINTSAARSFTLPTPASGLQFILKDSTGQAATNNISLIRAATEQIEGVAATKVLQTNWGSWRIISDGTNWFLIG